MLPQPEGATTGSERWRRNLTGAWEERLLGPRGEWWWSGRPPQRGSAPGVDAQGILSALPQLNLASCSRSQVQAYFDNGWTLTEVLFSALQGEEAFYRPPAHHLRHPLLFYYAHPAALYVNKLRLSGLLGGPINPYFEQLFETGVDEMRWDDLSKNQMELPTIEAVHSYRRAVYEAVRQVIATAPGLEQGHPPIGADDPLWALLMGFEHERIHLETSSVLIRELPLRLLRRPSQWPPDSPPGGPCGTTAPAEEVPMADALPLAGGEVVLGKPQTWPTYGWDNEYGRRTERVEPCEVSRRLITNGQFLRFVADGGYTQERWWSAEGWGWRTFRNAKWPTFWVLQGPAGLHEYALRTVFSLLPMPWRWPVVVNFHEAKAYCAWHSAQQGRRLPYRLLTEAEHHGLRHSSGSANATPPAEVDPTDGAASPYNLALRVGSECAVDAFPAERAGVHDLFGNLWQWCEDPFHPLAGFAVHRLYDDFSTPCFDGQHQMIIGGSFASCGDEASPFARFHFRPHFFQHAGFRLVAPGAVAAGKDPVASAKAMLHRNVYESDSMLSGYLAAHYAPPEELLPSGGPVEAARFPQRCAQLVLKHAAALGIEVHRAIDIGCGVGASSFALASQASEVVGIDRSAAFIAAAQQLKDQGRLSYARRLEGELTAQATATIDPAIDRSRVHFRQADACALPADLLGFDAALLGNVLCRLSSPRACLGRMGGPRGLIRPGGLVVLTSPYSWSEQFTSKGSWLGGYLRDGVPVHSIDGIAEALGPEFSLIAQGDLPLLLPEHARKFEYIVTHLTVWQRRR